MEFIISQILGVIALIIVSISYFNKNKNYFLFLQITANVFYASAFIVLDALVAGIITIISIGRCLYIYISEKYNFKYKYHLLPIFIILYSVTTYLCWTGWLCIIPLITATIFTYAFAIKNLLLMKYVLLIPNIMLVVYNLIVTTYASAILDAIELVVIVIAIIKFHKQDNLTLSENIKPNR